MTKKLVIVANLGRLKAYRVAKAAPGRGQKLDLVEDINFINAHTRFRDLVTDQAGRYGIDTGTAFLKSDYEALGAKREIQRRLVREVAEEIGRVLEEEEVEGWYLVAAPEHHDAILEEIRPEHRERLLWSVYADLVKSRPAVVLRQVKEATEVKKLI